MNGVTQRSAPLASGDPTGTWLERALTRAAGAPLVSGNSVRVLKDAAENYPAWLDAIASAQRTIHFESYLIHDDEIGAEFAAALAAKAAEGVRVRLIYDWIGTLAKTSRRFWREIERAGVEVRCFNPPRFDSLLGWLRRDHRKMVAVDGRVGFVTGLCVGRMWAGDAERGVQPWRDAGVAVRGPAVADIESAFAEIWGALGSPVPPEDRVPREKLSPAGNVALRVVATTPGTAGLFRLDQLIAVAARSTLWLADAYFAATPPYVQALCAAALDGVDVRLLVPGATDIPILRPLSRAGYRPLLEGGVRVFEWKGSMMHAKTAVADGLWARVGSSNLNLQSWLGNYELDVVVEDEQIAAQMEQMYLDDLENATEFVLGRRRVLREPGFKRSVDRPRLRRYGVRARARGSASRLTAGALRVGSTVSAAMADRRIFTPNEAHILAPAGFAVLAIAAVAFFWPRLLTIPLAALLVWVGATLLVRAYSLRRGGSPTSTPRPIPSQPSAEMRDYQHADPGGQP